MLVREIRILEILSVKKGEKLSASEVTEARWRKAKLMKICDVVIYLQFAETGQWLKWFCEAGGGSHDEATLEQTPYPFQPH